MNWKPRHSVLIVLFAAWLLCYVDRMVMASAIPFIAKEFQLSPLAMGSVMSAFFIGYAAMQIPGGLLVDRFGPSRIMVLAVLSWSVFTAMTGLTASLASLLVVRVLFGLCEGAFPAAASKTLVAWFPPREIGRVTGAVLMAVQFGAFLAPSLVAILVINWGWRAAFYSLLIPGLCLVVAIRHWIVDAPALSKHATVAALAGNTDHAKHSAERIDIKELFRNRALRWCFATALFSNLATWGLLNWLPTYFLEARGFSIAKMGALTPLPFLGGAVGYFLGGHVSDKYFHRKRHIPVACGLVLSAGFTHLASLALSGELAVVYLAAAFLFLSGADAGICTLPLVIVDQKVAGSAFGAVNTAAQCAGFVSPVLMGYVLGESDGNFGIMFLCFVGFLIVAACTASQIRQPLTPQPVDGRQLVASKE